MAAVRFTNPSTATVYRLVDEAVGWRITKSMHVDGRLRLVHLRGAPGSGAVDADAVARLVAGHGGVAARASDPAAVFAAVVLLDLVRTADVLTAIAREAAAVCEAGCRGFRPRSPVLRKQRDDAMARAVAECRILATAWRESGLVAEPIPGWLSAALADAG